MAHIKPAPLDARKTRRVGQPGTCEYVLPVEGPAQAEQLLPHQVVLDRPNTHTSTHTFYRRHDLRRTHQVARGRPKTPPHHSITSCGTHTIRAAHCIHQVNTRKGKEQNEREEFLGSLGLVGFQEYQIYIRDIRMFRGMNSIRLIRVIGV